MLGCCVACPLPLYEELLNNESVGRFMGFFFFSKFLVTCDYLLCVGAIRCPCFYCYFILKSVVIYFILIDGFYM